jgi:pimeloyl-ACP methyl ester carboxylesterase
LVFMIAMTYAMDEERIRIPEIDINAWPQRKACLLDVAMNFLNATNRALEHFRNAGGQEALPVENGSNSSFVLLDVARPTATGMTATQTASGDFSRAVREWVSLGIEVYAHAAVAPSFDPLFAEANRLRLQAQYQGYLKSVPIGSRVAHFGELIGRVIENGFVMNVFVKTDSALNPHVTVAFAGTHNLAGVVRDLESRGIGRTTGDDVFEREVKERLLANLRNAFGDRPCSFHAIGHSLGSVDAQRFVSTVARWMTTDGNPWQQMRISAIHMTCMNPPGIEREVNDAFLANLARMPQDDLNINLTYEFSTRDGVQEAGASKLGCGSRDRRLNVRAFRRDSEHVASLASILSLGPHVQSHAVNPQGIAITELDEAERNAWLEGGLVSGLPETFVQTGAALLQVPVRALQWALEAVESKREWRFLQ